jgi:isopentenyldiphosphate isomerase
MKLYGDHEVDIFDDHGNVIGVKARKDVDKPRDILHVVYSFVVTPEGKLILSRIPRDPAKKNLFPGKLGVTVATILRHNEHHLDAAKRSLAKEVGITEPDLQFLGETMEAFHNSPKRLISAYICTAAESDLKPNPEDVEELLPVTRTELEDLLDRNEFAPTLLTLWDRYSGEL